MKTILAILSLVLLTLCAEAASAAAPKPLRVLLVTGVDYPGHDWKQTGPAIRKLLEADHRIEVRIVEDAAFLASEAIFDYDVLFMHFKNYDPLPREKQIRENLVRFVEGGKGLVFCHFACGAFPDWPEFASLAGRIWDQKLTHDPRGPFSVKIDDSEHPITQGMRDFQADDELYFCLKGDVPVRVLATAHSKVTGKDHPMAFTFTRGQGRVFHTPLGHDVRALEMPGVAELLRRGTVWAGLPDQAVQPPPSANEVPATGTKFVFRPAKQAGYYDFDTGVLRGRMRWDGHSQGISDLLHVASGVQIVQSNASLFCPYRVFSRDMRYGDAARDWPTITKVLDDGALEVHWPAMEEHPLEMRAVYRWAAADALDLTLTAMPRRNMPRFEIFLASYFASDFRASVYAKPNMFSKGNAELLKADVNPLVDGSYLMFPRDRAAELLLLDSRWDLLPNPVQWSITRHIAGPLALRKEESSGLTAVVMSPPDDCFAVSMPYNKIPPDGVAGHASLYLSLFGCDLKSGESRTVRSRLIVLKNPTDAQIIERYEKYTEK